ncbi:hypothetical protein [Brevundimonas sp. GCM10030266]|uniref:hypothetical protein n=1 Tax=Brevundimonas sp. GCM10030266 TaxID=3273386 RepID=UPI0036091F74
MTVRKLALIALPALALLGACASDHELTATSNCHTSDGQYVNAPNCTIRYGWSQTTTTSTTTTVVTEETNVPPAEPAAKTES